MVEFSQTDMAGIVHFANFFRMMESTEHEFFRTIGLNEFHFGLLGGIPLLMKTLLDHGFLHGDCLTVTGRTMAENMAAGK